MPRVDIERLKKQSIERLCEAGVSKDQAEILVDHMLTADLWGRGSHGLSVRFCTMYSHATEGAGEQPCDIVQDSGHHVVVDGNGGFGYVAGRHAAEILTKRAQEHGVACVALRNTIHTGMIGYYGNLLAENDIVSILAADCLPLMAPCGGTEALLGTNPVCFGFPTEDDPILVDMATSALSYGKVIEHDEEGEPLPDDVALDANGKPTHSASEARDGVLLPFGGHRGGALAVAVQLLAGALTGADPVPEEGDGYGLLMVGLQKGVFAGNVGYGEAVAEFARRYENVPNRDGAEVRLPGKRRYQNQRANREAGEIEISDELADMLDL